ncbi:C_GCAxxG_C_C family probable redox protein [Alkalithermobacter thermoalcaliphilus JW-YL-7 = DSM 7308]|uniref:C_GCAxxG_C_C family probable redox protein n=1 Tax=Alkalithermobacter thermoalcaliphilus JW-YL-7 = DSM 7308 TaxID=1121328 RepID=A0A150FQF9_CLOPD|nr:C_GCAxxG_C_C family protein [[Clostridium] paradoxum JW-YL-7 = DSM 7308]SHK79794.1 C_GCAxxG_C_C family probable redox protein [[Clostridium] paradoxum JW-YL-7 = DSM 7308]
METNNQKLIQEARTLAENYYKDGKYLCSEAILAAINKVLECGLPDNYISLVSGFPVGMGGSGCSCGALTGAQAAIGLVHGRKKAGGSNAKIMKLSQQLHDEFKKKYKSACCRVLIKDYKFGSKEHKERCTNVTADTCEMAMRIILENQGILSRILNVKKK